MSAALSANLKRGLEPLKARSDTLAELGEDARDILMTRVEAWIAHLRETSPAEAVEAEQQAKLLKLRYDARWWQARRHWRARMLLGKAI